MVPTTVKRNAALAKAGKSKAAPTDDKQLAELDAMDTDDVDNAMNGRRVSDTTANSKRQLSKATRHNTKLKKDSTAEKHKAKENEKIYVPNVLTPKDGTFQSFDVKTRGYNKSNFPIEHHADTKIKNYKLDNGKYGKDKTGKNTNATWISSGRYMYHVETCPGPSDSTDP